MSDRLLSPVAADVYYFGSHSYLERARQCLLEKTRRYLFYAALELRGCIEARQDEYLDAQKRYRRSLRKSWQSGKKAKELNRIFNEDQIAKVTLNQEEFSTLTLFHVPVKKALVNQTNKLGYYLHAEPAREPNEAWWREFASLLLDTYCGAWVICRGNLLCPPLLNADGTTMVAIEFDHASELASQCEDRFSAGRRLVASVAYLDSPPAEWRCDLEEVRAAR